MAGYVGRHCAARPARGGTARNAAILAAAAAVTVTSVSGAVPLAVPPPSAAAGTAHAGLVSYSEAPGARMLDQAETRTGDWYLYGAAGPYSFDCSGLVYWAAGRIGLRDFPRDTYQMAHSPRLTRTYHPVRGDLAFWGSRWSPYHVEFVTIWWHTTFGAQHTGTRVGWHRWWTPPSFYMHVAW
jgi:cell wall-associated NlpC family hydrolase